MTDVLFYHLSEHTLQRALPVLLEKSLQKGWSVTVQASSDKLLADLDAHLWSYKPDSFFAHGIDSGDSSKIDPALCPIWLTTSTANPNASQARFIVEGAIPGPLDQYERVIYMFDGLDDDAVAAARERFRVEKAAGHNLTYWQQDESGRWVQKA